MIRFRRWICRAFHGPEDIAFSGRATYQCRRCLLWHETPWSQTVIHERGTMVRPLAMRQNTIEAKP